LPTRTARDVARLDQASPPRVDLTFRPSRPNIEGPDFISERDQWKFQIKLAVVAYVSAFRISTGARPTPGRQPKSNRRGPASAETPAVTHSRRPGWDATMHSGAARNAAVPRMARDGGRDRLPHQGTGKLIVLGQNIRGACPKTTHPVRRSAGAIDPLDLICQGGAQKFPDRNEGKQTTCRSRNLRGSGLLRPGHRSRPGG